MLENLIFKNYLNPDSGKKTLMPLRKERRELETVLRDNLITAYLDYAMEFGSHKAKKILNESSKMLRKNGGLKG